MAEIAQALYTRLSGYSGLTSLVSTRIYPNVLPQGVTYPAVSYHRVSTVRNSAMGSDIGVASPRFQLDAWGATYSDALSVKAQLKSAMERWTGTVDSVEVLDTYIMNEYDLYDSTVPIHRILIDVEINHRE